MKIVSEKEMPGFRERPKMLPVPPVPKPAEDALAPAIDLLRKAVEKMSVQPADNSGIIATVVDAQIDNMKAIQEVLDKLTEMQRKEVPTQRKKKWQFTPVRDNRGFIETITVEEL